MAENYGIGSRDIAHAGKLFLIKKFQGSDQTIHDIGQRWGKFCEYAEPHGVKKMEVVTREFVIDYGQALQKGIEGGVYKTSSLPKNLISSINTVMRLAIGKQWQTVKPGKDCGIQARSYIPKESKALSEGEHNEALSKLDDERLEAIMGLQRYFGLRFKESCMLDAKAALRHAKKYNEIKLVSGTKGGKPRRGPCRACGFEALEKAVAIQEGNSLIPKDQSYREFHKWCYNRSDAIKLGGFHSERHFYAQERYEELIGAPAPINAGWTKSERILNLSVMLEIDLETARERDEAARLQVSIELGHQRAQITRTYIG